jgi:dihydrofolate reductase
MRTLKIIEHVSLDGVIQVSGDDFPYGDWSAPYRTPEGLAMVLAEWGERFDLLIGRHTYDQWSTYWPKAPQSPMADRLNAATKYVVTHRPESLAWGTFEGVGPDLVEAVSRIKAMDGPNLILSGSASLTSPLLEHGLVEEMLLLVNPVLIGQGKRLFAAGTPPRAFTFEGAQVSPTGILINKYRAAGPLPSLTTRAG